MTKAIKDTLFYQTAPLVALFALGVATKMQEDYPDIPILNDGPAALLDGIWEAACVDTEVNSEDPLEDVRDAQRVMANAILQNGFLGQLLIDLFIDI